MNIFSFFAEPAWNGVGPGDIEDLGILPKLIEEDGVFPSELRSPWSKVDENDIVFFKTKITVLHEIQLLENHGGADEKNNSQGELSDNQNSPES